MHRRQLGSQPTKPFASCFDRMYRRAILARNGHELMLCKSSHEKGSPKEVKLASYEAGSDVALKDVLSGDVTIQMMTS